MNRLIQQLSASPTNVQLICFPFAGGYSATFRPLQPHLQDHCDLLVAEPPGHGSNRMPLVESLETLVDIYLDALIPKLGKQLVLFGHSMGGLVVYRVAQQLEQRGIIPDAVIISAVQPPHTKRKTLSHLNDGAFLDYVIDIGGIPAELVMEREVLEYFLPMIRADFKALETFEHTNHCLLQASVHILNGKKDEPCIQDAAGWRQWTNRIRFHTFEGGHMFLLSETERVAKTIQSILSLETTRKELMQV